MPKNKPAARSMPNARERALFEFEASGIPNTPLNWHIWKRAFHQGISHSQEVGILKWDGGFRVGYNTHQEELREAIKNEIEFILNKNLAKNTILTQEQKKTLLEGLMMKLTDQSDVVNL